MEDDDLELEESPSGALEAPSDSEHAGFKVELDIDDDLNGYLLVTCPACGKQGRHAFADLKDGDVIGCECGELALTIGNETLVNTQAGLDSLASSFDQLRKSFRDFGK